MRHAWLFVLLMPLLTVVLTGCGPSCQSTCEKLYQADECNTERPGRTTDELLQACNNSCEDALTQPGEIDNFNPYSNEGSSSSITLDNEQQAALWMDCIAEQACDKIADGYCSPVW